MIIHQPERFFADSLTLSREQKQWRVSYANPDSPFHKIIGNLSAVEQSELIVYQAIGRPNHRISDINIAWTGPAGVGKTMFARAIAKALELPFVEIDPQSVSTPEDIFDKIQEVLEATVIDDELATTLAMRQQEDGSWFAPSCVVFIDEVHQLSKPLVQALLRATEPSTHMLEGKTFRLDTQAIQWQFATTDRGLLFDAFDTRFMKIELKPYTREEMAKIIHSHCPNLSHETCKHIAKYYSLVTREALRAATRVEWEQNMRGFSWRESVEAVRLRDGIDDFGLTDRQLKVLKSLGYGKKSLASLASAAGCKVEEMEKFVLPPLMMLTEDFEPLIETGPGGRYITVAGLHELDRRGIPHAGENALSKFAKVSSLV